MKKFILAMALLATVPAFADSINTVLAPFSGKISVEAPGVVVTSVDVEVTNQFCNFWGTTCAGGPRETEKLPLVITSDNGMLITFTNEKSSGVRSLKIGNRFSSCDVRVVVHGIATNGENTFGHNMLVFSNEKELCSSKSELTKLVKAQLAKPLILTEREDVMGKIYFSIK